MELKLVVSSIIVTSVLLLLVGCEGGEPPSSEPEEISPSEPEKINGILVPSDSGTTGDETLAGIDSNDNGIRDDVERFIAQEFGDDKAAYDVAVEQAVTINKLLQSDRSESDIEGFNTLIDCSENKDLESMKKIETRHLNTKARHDEFSELFSGKITSVGGTDCDS